MSKKVHDKEIVTMLNEVLGAELIAVNQYFMHAKMCSCFGYEKLGKIVKSHSIDEMHHADELIDRILYLGGLPNLQKLGKINVGEIAKEQFQLDFELKKVAISRLNQGIALCNKKNDAGSRLLLEKLLSSEEEHCEWLETQLKLIDSLGEENYLTNQI